MNNNSLYKKQSGSQGEELVQQYYESHGFVCKNKNFTIRGGEIDLIMEDEKNIVFVEVKVVNYIENLHDYITPKKMQALQRSLETYLWRYPSSKDKRVDVVFVKDGAIIHVYDNVEL